MHWGPLGIEPERHGREGQRDRGLARGGSDRQRHDNLIAGSGV
jgi:hypothetical protein